MSPRLLRAARPVALLALAASLGAPPAAAQPSPSASTSAPVAAAGSAQAPLPELPRLAPIARPEPDPAAAQDLASLLGRITSADGRARDNAKAALEQAEPALVSAIRQKLQEIRAAVDRDAAARLLEQARKDGRKRRKVKDDKNGKAAAGDPGEEGDWLEFMLESPQPRDETWRDLTQIYAMARLLANIGTTPAVRELVAMYAYFGDLVRVEVQRHLAKLKERAVPALIEARQHDAKSVQRWADRQLDALGRAIPGEAVATSDTQVLADVLRAYGRTRDVDALRVVLSFCDSDRVQLRDAAREAVTAIGEPGLWQLRDGYLGLTGEKPPRAWTWDRIARELFALYDRARLAEVHRLMDEGLAAAAAGKPTDAIAAFDKVLARVPLYDRRREMAPAYVARARELEDDRRAESLELLRKALRLDPRGEGAAKTEAEIAYLEGMILIEQGTPDKFVLTRALELDPTHERARRALDSLGDKALVQQDSRGRYRIAAGVGVAALVALLLLARRRPAPPGPPAEPVQPG
jgi:tetratricopeptide (TPR) repeat protein